MTNNMHQQVPTYNQALIEYSIDRCIKLDDFALTGAHKNVIFTVQLPQLRMLCKNCIRKLPPRKYMKNTSIEIVPLELLGK